MRSSIVSLHRRWIKPFGLVALSIFGIYVLITGLSSAAPSRSARAVPTLRTYRNSAGYDPPRSGTTVVGRVDHMRDHGYTAVDVLPQADGNLLIARLRELLGMRADSAGALVASTSSAERLVRIVRALRHARVERDGRISCTGLSPGDYVVIEFSLAAAPDVAGRHGAFTVLTGKLRIAPRSAGRTVTLARLMPLR